MELDNSTLIRGSLVDVPVAATAAIGTTLGASWSAAAWYVVTVMAVKTLGEARVVALIKRGVL